MVTGGHLNRPPLIKLKSFGGLKWKYIYTQYFSLFSLWVSRYCYSQCSGGHITTASDRLQRKRPGSEAPQTHRAPPRDLCMNRTPSTRRQHINWARGKFQWSYSHWLQWEGHTVNKRERGCKKKKLVGWFLIAALKERKCFHRRVNRHQNWEKICTCGPWLAWIRWKTSSCFLSLVCKCWS